ncbi:MAG: hypothetical protein D3922_08195 [Candidatus Electrothrix sp. AR1]|nr:hypothetical protein [Candidatus Electrothrix sp. AR1]
MVAKVELLVGINDSLKELIENATTRQEKNKLLIKQAIFVYEMAGVTLELLNGLILEGKGTIENLYQEAQKKVASRVAAIERKIQKAREFSKKDLISVEASVEEIEKLELLRQANERSLGVWEKVVAQMDIQEEFIKDLQKKKALIKYKRDQAQVQLETLRDIRQVKELRDVIGSLDELVISISELDLLRLDEDTVGELLGYPVKDDSNSD